MEPIRQLQHHVLPRWPEKIPEPSVPVDTYIKNAEQLGDLGRLRQNETSVQRELRRESWKEIYDRECEHQKKLLALLKEAQDAWLDAFRASYKTNQEAFERISRMWSNYFSA